MAIEVLIFQVEGRRFGIPSLSVIEVVRAATLSPLPKPSAIVEGLLNLRGRVLPVVDVRRLFQLPTRDILQTDHFVVVQSENRMAALRVDQALDLVRLQFDDPTESSSLTPLQDVISAIGRTKGGIVHILDTQKLLGADDTNLSLVERSATEALR